MRASERPSVARATRRCVHFSLGVFRLSLGGCRRRCVRAAKRATPACLASARFRTRGRDSTSVPMPNLQFLQPNRWIACAGRHIFWSLSDALCMRRTFQQRATELLWDCKNITHRQNVSTQKSFFQQNFPSFIFLHIIFYPSRGRVVRLALLLKPWADKIAVPKANYKVGV